MTLVAVTRPLYRLTPIPRLHIIPHHLACTVFGPSSPFTTVVKEHAKPYLITPATPPRMRGDIIDEKRILRKLDWHFVPGLTLLLSSFLNRRVTVIPSLSFIFLQLEMLIFKV